MSITIRVDTELDVAYIRLSDGAVANTVEFNDDVLVDVDEFGVAVGIEVLSSQAPIPFANLVTDFHVHSDVIELLRLIRPDVDSFLRLTKTNDGVSTARDLTPTHAA